MFNAYATLLYPRANAEQTAYLEPTTAEVRAVAVEQNHVPDKPALYSAMPDYREVERADVPPSTIHPVQIASWPVYMNGAVWVYVRTVPGLPDSAIWVLANHIS